MRGAPTDCALLCSGGIAISSLCRKFIQSAHYGGGQASLPTANLASGLRSEHSVPRILLIDDFEPFRASLRDALVRIGLEIVEAEGLAAAQQALRSQSCDLVLTDLAMPDADGTEVLDTIKRCQPETPVVVISGSIAQSDVGAHQPVDAWLEKPCSIAALRAAVREALRQRALPSDSRGEEGS